MVRLCSPSIPSGIAGLKSKLGLVYQKLYSYFGPQHWWPAQSSFEVMVGAILTQNTSWANVEKAIANLRKNRLLQPRKLYQLSHRRLATFIKPAGYYNIKARRLKEFLDFLFYSYGGRLERMGLEDTAKLRRRLLCVNGIGPETADSILLYALDRAVFVVDAYTKRILSRHRLIREDASYDEVQNLFRQNLKNDLNYARTAKSRRKKNRVSGAVKLFNEYHALLVKLGKEFCLKNKPKCDICPLK